MGDLSSQRIEFFKDLLSSVDAMAFTELAPDFNLITTTSPHPDTMLTYFRLGNDYTGPNLAEEGVELEEVTTPKPLVCSNDLGMVWISNVEIRDGEAKKIYLLGPVFLDDWEVQNIEKQLTKHKMSIPLKRKVMGYIKDTPVIPLSRFYEYGAMLYYCIYGEKISVSEFCFANVERGNNESLYTQEHYGTLAIEQEILNIVEQGNPNYQSVLDKYVNATNLKHVGGSGMFRQQKDTVIMFITLCSRAAIRGGLPSETAFSLCDNYISRVEKARNLETLTLLNWEMFGDFVMRVHRRHSSIGQVSPQVQKVCDAISLHPEEKADIHKFAQQLGYTDYYFSNKFKQEVGMSIRDFAMNEKIKRAKTLLSDTAMPVQDIAAELGFGSQSYFGELFRKKVGMTPGEFRAQGMMQG